MENKIKAYKELLGLVEKYEDVFAEDNILPRINNIKGIIRTLEVSNRFGIPVNALSSCDWFRIKDRWDDTLILSLLGEKYGRTISWSDDGSQPEDEWLFRIGFPTGAYIFGDSYPQKTFNEFFNELKSYSPKYTDSANHCLYFDDNVAKVVYENFDSIFKKYKALVADELKEKRKAELEAELAKLKGE